jgi:hypothetical protein
MSSKYKIKNGCTFYKINPNKQCIFCNPHVGIAFGPIMCVYVKDHNMIKQIATCWTKKTTMTNQPQQFTSCCFYPYHIICYV